MPNFKLEPHSGIRGWDPKSLVNEEEVFPQVHRAGVKSFLSASFHPTLDPTLGRPPASKIGFLKAVSGYSGKGRKYAQCSMHGSLDPGQYCMVP